MMENEREIGIYVRIREESTNTGMSEVVVLHSRYFILWTLETSHDPMAPCVPSPWPLGTLMAA